MAINRASIFYAVIQREFDVALQYAEWALALAPDDPANTLAMAQVHFYQGDLAAAEREFQAYIELTDGGGQMAGRLCLGALCLLEGRISEALRQTELGIELAISLDDAGAEGRLRAFPQHLSRGAGKLEEAGQEAEKAVRLDDKGGLSVWALQAIHDQGPDRA